MASDPGWARTFAHVTLPLDLPLFPLGSVLFPGQALPLRIFEDRYVTLVQDLLAVEDPAERLFGSVAIREGHEVGEHGFQSLHRVGCTVQLTDVQACADGSFDVVGVVRGRFRLDAVRTEAAYAVARVLPLDERPPTPEDEELALRARRRFDTYRATVSAWREDPAPGVLPRDPEFLSWSMAAAIPLPLPDRQSLLEAEDTGVRLALLDELLSEELRVMAAIPSLPATEVARSRWSPN